MVVFNFNDFHIGKGNKSKRLVDNLISFFLSNKSILSKVDVIVISGDFFDKMLTTVSVDWKLAIKAMSYLVLFCKTHNIKLRTLEGTPSHDNKQMESIAVAINDLVNEIDYKHIPTLTIEVINGYKCLFLPDKYRETGEEIREAIEDKLKEHNLDKVDMVFAHGNFSYQLPNKLKSALDEEFFLNITKYYIVIGHIHIRSIWLRIIAPGSFDRIDANQESPKGGVLIKLGRNIDDSSFKFLDNENAMIYDTIDIRDIPVKEAYKLLRKHIKVKSLSEYDTIRLRADSGKYKEISDSIKEDGIYITLRPFIENTVKENIVSSVDTIKKVDLISITPDNIGKLILSRESFKDASTIEANNLLKLIDKLSE